MAASTVAVQLKIKDLLKSSNSLPTGPFFPQMSNKKKPTKKLGGEELQTTKQQLQQALYHNKTLEKSLNQQKKR